MRWNSPSRYTGKYQYNSGCAIAARDTLTRMALPLTGRTALVTGASKGVGKGIALELARNGSDVAVNYNRDQAGAEATVSEIRSIGPAGFAVQADVGAGAQVDRMFRDVLARFHKLDILVNNAGVQTW